MRSGPGRTAQRAALAPSRRAGPRPPADGRRRCRCPPTRPPAAFGSRPRRAASYRLRTALRCPAARRGRRRRRRPARPARAAPRACRADPGRVRRPCRRRRGPAPRPGAHDDHHARHPRLRQRRGSARGHRQPDHRAAPGPGQPDSRTVPAHDRRRGQRRTSRRRRLPGRPGPARHSRHRSLHLSRTASPHPLSSRAGPTGTADARLCGRAAARDEQLIEAARRSLPTPPATAAASARPRWPRSCAARAGRSPTTG